MRSASTPSNPTSFSQRCGRLKTSFALARKHLDYAVETKKEASFQQKVAWDSIAPRSSYFTTVEPDRILRWVAFFTTGLALFAALRGGPQPLTFLLYAGTALVLILGAALTSGMRRIAYTAIPAKGINILVLKDKQHDCIIGSIENARAAALAKFAEPAPGMSVRDHLRRLRWLVEANAMSAEEFAQRQKLVMPDETRVMLQSPPPAEDDMHVRQRRSGVTIDVALHRDHLTYRRSTWFGGTEAFSVPYRNLSAPTAHFQSGHQIELTLMLLGWAGVAVLAWANAVAQVHSPDYYVGGPGLARALSDFGPVLLAMLAACAIVPVLTRVRYACPYQGIELLRDKQYDAILAAIEERRLAAQRGLAEPDPLLMYEEQMRILNDLRDEEIISDEEHGRSAKRAVFICDHPLLDRPVIEERQPQRAREYALH